MRCYDEDPTCGGCLGPRLPRRDRVCAGGAAVRACRVSGLLDALFLFVTTAFPKAGIQLGELPLTLNLALLALLLLSGFPTALKALGAFRGVLQWFACLVVFGAMSTLIAWLDGASLYSVAQRITVMVSPLAVVATFRLATRRSLRIVAWALVITGGYALVQFAGGVTATSVSGITYTMGQDLEAKPIGYMANDSAAKIPSTYQNGSSFGIFAALAVMLMLAWRPESGGLRRLRIVAIASGVVGLLLCGSRSIIIPVVLCLAVVIYQHLATLSRARQQWAMIVLIVAILCGAVFLTFFRSDILAAFWDRNVVQTMNDPTASGRTNQWSEIWSGIQDLSDWQLIRLILIGQNPSWRLGGEGLPEFFVTFGLPATFAFYGGLLVLARRLWQNPLSRSVALGVLCVVFAFVVDQSYFYPPNVMNVYLIATLAFRLRPNDRQIASVVDKSTRDIDVAPATNPSDPRSRERKGLRYLSSRQQSRPMFIQRHHAPQREQQRSTLADVVRSAILQRGFARPNAVWTECTVSRFQSALGEPFRIDAQHLLSRRHCCEI